MLARADQRRTRFAFIKRVPENNRTSVAETIALQLEVITHLLGLDFLQVRLPEQSNLGCRADLSLVADLDHKPFPKRRSVW